MARDLPTGYAAETENTVFPPIILVFLDWPNDPVYAWNGYGNLSWDSQTWVGTGHLGTFSPISESGDLRANGTALTLSGIPSDLITKAFANDFQGVDGKIWLGEISSDGTLPIDPYLAFDGFIDNSAFEESGIDGGETSIITVNLEKEMIDRRIVGRRNTHEDQQIDAPGDLYYEYVAWLANNPIPFGPVTTPGAATAPGGGGSSTQAISHNNYNTIVQPQDML